MTVAGVSSRRTAIAALVRIEADGAYANLVLPGLLDQSDLDERDRRFVTELVYGATRMRRALDYLADRFIERPDVDTGTRAALRIGAYQIQFLDTPVHAAVDATVAATPRRSRGFVNAVLRKVASHPPEWPSDAIRLSYPDWLVARLEDDLGPRYATVLEAMNEPAEVHVRDDGYRQDLASQEVVALVGSPRRVLDLCAGPGGKATGMAARSSFVVGTDIHTHRARLVRSAAHSTGHDVAALVADGRRAPFRPASFDAVLVDAPCSGLGSLRRRPDARWRIRPGDIDRLVHLQVELVLAAAELVVPGGRLVYSVCTLTRAESIVVDDRLASERPDLVADPLPAPWEPWGRGGRLLPDVYPGDGMMAYRYARRD